MENRYLDIVGKYTSAKVFTDNIEPEALKMIYDLCNHPVFENAKIRVMSDVHAGRGIVIGFSCPIGEAVAPAHVGCDIGCQMTTIELSKTLTEDQYVLFEHRVKQSIPTGFNINEKPLDSRIEKHMYSFMTTEYNKARSAWPEMIPDIGLIDEEYINDLLHRIGMDPNTFYKSIGTLGGGNHFLEYGESDNGIGYFTVHCGPRNFGVKVFNYWNKVANSDKLSKDELKRITEEIKLTCSDKKKWKQLIDNAKEDVHKRHVNGYLYGSQLRGYLSDMVVCQAYASFNHFVIISRVEDVLQKFGIQTIQEINTVHNYIDFTDHIIRKGAINASAGKTVIIPFNMRDGLAICRGKGNEDWNCTAPHGAGRIMSRSAAKKAIKLNDFKKSMEGIYSTSICEGTIDESPMVYKPADEIIELIKPTVDVLFFIKPKINIKATDGAD